MSRKSQLSKNKARHTIEAQQTTQVVHQRRSGPLPPPEDIERYEAISPGFAKELLEMAKSSQDHIQKMQSEDLEMQRAFAERHYRLFGIGQIFAMILGLAGITSGTLIAVMGDGDSKAGATVIGSVMAVLGGAFVWGKWQERKSPKDSSS